MPGRELTPRTDSYPETTSRSTKMGVFKLAFGGEIAPTATTTTAGGVKPSPFRPGRRFVIPSYTPTSARVQPMAKYYTSPLAESPELERFPVATSGAVDTISEDDTMSVFTASTRTSNSNVTISDDDISLVDDFASLRPADFAPARHSTACCTDLALRRELRKVKFHRETSPLVDELSTPISDTSFAMGHSFRRELDIEDRVESLALWEEEASDALSSLPSRGRSLSKDQQIPHSWHADPASARSSRNKTLESLFRKPKKAFFHNLFSSLPFSSSRRSSKKS